MGRAPGHSGGTVPPATRVGDPLPLVTPPPARFANYLGRTNAPVVARLEAHARHCLAGRAGPAPVLLLGPRGSGKSHLARALVAEVSSGGGEAAYVDLGAAGPETGRELLLAGGWSRYGLVVLDGVEVLCGGRGGEEALLALLVDLAAARTPVVLAARPDGVRGLAWSLPDVGSRLRACEVLVLRPLTDEERRAVLRDYFAACRVPVGDDVLAWLEARAPRDAKSLKTLASRLVHEGARRKRRINTSLAATVLRDVPDEPAAGDADGDG